jgi:ubiquinone/menaquinone biosynthesis C-methylase UbiE
MKLNTEESWNKYKQTQSSDYEDFNYGLSLQSWTMMKSHQIIEKPFRRADYFENVLEIGAGTGSHYKHVHHSFKKYIMTDVNENMLNIARKKNRSKKCYFEKQNGRKLNFRDNSFDRLVAVHVLEHITEPHLVLAEWHRVVKDNGTISVLIPTDPGLLWRLGKHLGPRRKTISKGIAYDYVMAREHVNSCSNLVSILNHLFTAQDESWWPLKIPSVDLNLYYSFHTKVRKK